MAAPPPVSSTESALTLAFAPRLFDRIVVAILLLAGLESAYLVARLAIWKPASSVTCSRAAGTCVAEVGSMVGTQTFALPIASLARSRVVAGRHGARWLVARDGNDFELGTPSTDAARIATYRRLADQLDAFLGDRSAPAFSASYTSFDATAGLIVAPVAVLLIVLALRWWNGWRATLVFDRAAGQLAIVRRPALFGGGRRTYALAEVAGVETSQTRTVTTRGTFLTTKLVVRARDGRALFGYRMLLDRKARAATAARCEAARAFLAR